MFVMLILVDSKIGYSKSGTNTLRIKENSQSFLEISGKSS